MDYSSENGSQPVRLTKEVSIIMNLIEGNTLHSNETSMSHFNENYTFPLAHFQNPLISIVEGNFI